MVSRGRREGQPRSRRQERTQGEVVDVVDDLDVVRDMLREGQVVARADEVVVCTHVTTEPEP